MVWKSSKKRKQKREAKLRNQGDFYLLPHEILLCIANMLDVTTLVKLTMCCKALQSKLQTIKISCMTKSFGYVIDWCIVDNLVMEIATPYMGTNKVKRTGIPRNFDFMSIYPSIISSGHQKYYR